MNQIVTGYTVAERAGVSIATVSRTLAGSLKVAPHTRQRVLPAVDELHFVPDPAARRLAYQRTDTIALVFSDISGPYYSSVIRGVEQAARHLLHHAYERFAIMTGPLNSLDNWERLDGDERALADAGLSKPSERVVSAHFK